MGVLGSLQGKETLFLLLGGVARAKQNETINKVLPLKGFGATMQGKSKKKGLFLIKVWLGLEDMQRESAQAEKLGLRRVGLPIKTQKPNGFADEWRANTDGISKLYKFYSEYYRKTEARRLQEAADIAKQEQQLAERKAGLGFAGLFVGLQPAKQKSPQEGGGVD